MVGQTISHYKILDKLGQGGMGVVYRAEDTKLKREVALKFLPPHLLGDSDIRARFEREAQAAAALHHPNICPVHEIDQVDDRSFIAMAFIEGESLDKKIAKGPLKLDEALSIAQQIAEGLEAAHERGIHHRDIKPENVIVDAKGRVTIMDFGLAQLTEASRLTRKDETVGTVFYMSPEQTDGSGTDHRTDIWALGVVLYEMVTGQQPFKGDYDKAVMYSILNEEPEPITALRTGVPMELEWTVGKCLTKDVDQRFQSTADLLLDLQAVNRKLESGKSTIRRTEAGDRTVLGQPVDAATRPSDQPLSKYRVIEPLEAQGEGVVYRAEDTQLRQSVAIRILPESDAKRLALRQRLRRATVTAVVAMIALLAGVLATVQFRGRSPQPEKPLRRFSFTPERLRVSDRTEHPATSPDGKFFTYVAGGDGSGLWIRDLASEQPRAIEGTEGAESPCWSPDSQFIVFAADGDVKRIPAQGGPATTICELPQPNYFGCTVSPDGDSVVFAAGGPYRLYEVPARAGSPRLLAELDWSGKGPSTTRPHFLPSASGGRTLVYGKGSAGGEEIYVWDMDEGEPEALRDGGDTPVYSPSGHIVYGLASDLWALPFSLETLSATGEPFQIAQDGTHHSISDDGTLIYIDQVRGRQGLVWLDRKGNNLGAIGQPQQQIAGLDLSPDGRRVVVSGRENGNVDVWVHEVDRALRQRVTVHSGFDGNAIWSPSNNEVTFNSTREGYYDIYSRPVDGTQEPEFLVGTPQFEVPNDWTPDGRHLLYRANDPQTGANLWSRERKQDGSGFEAKPFLQTPFIESQAGFSPNGRFVAYQSNKSGRNEIYVRTFPDGESEWLVSTNGGARPRWSGSGEELFYVEGDTLVAVSVSTGATFSIGATTPLFRRESLGGSSWNYDVNADGQKFVAVETLELPDAEPPSVRVVENWYEEFRVRE